MALAALFLGSSTLLSVPLVLASNPSTLFPLLFLTRSPSQASRPSQEQRVRLSISEMSRTSFLLASELVGMKKPSTTTTRPSATTRTRFSSTELYTSVVIFCDEKRSTPTHLRPLTRFMHDVMKSSRDRFTWSRV